MMDELVQDLVSALEQSSEQRKLGELWEEMMLNPLQQRRQVRRRRAQRRHREASVYPYWLEASESSMDEASRSCRRSLAAASVANCSDSDELTVSNPWHRVSRRPLRPSPTSWPDYESYTENTPGRPLRRRRKVKRVTSDVSTRMQTKLRVPNVNRRQRHRPPRVQHLSGSNRSGGWVRADQQTEGARLMGQEHWTRTLSQASEHQDGAEEKMSDGETSSTCSSDPGLFTNDEGRQGDDEQSDWFVEGDCGVRTGVRTSLLPHWDSDRQLSLEETCSSLTFLHPARSSRRGYCSRFPGSAACSIRKERRRYLSKGRRMPVFVKRLRPFSEERYQRDFWLSSLGKRDQSQLNTLCPSPVRPIDMVPESPHLRCSTSVWNNRQHNLTPRTLCRENMRRRKRTSEVPARSLSHKDELRHDAYIQEAFGASTAVADCDPNMTNLN